MGGTDWRFADIVAPAFLEILEIAKPKSICEIGFNAGGSALMFLSINSNLIYHSIDIYENTRSVQYLKKQFHGFDFLKSDSKDIKPGGEGLFKEYGMVFVDGEHSREGVVNDIEKALLFKPQYILLDDVLHPSHLHIHDLITNEYAEKLDVVKLFEFNQCWQGYSMALCKVK